MVPWSANCWLGEAVVIPEQYRGGRCGGVSWQARRSMTSLRLAKLQRVTGSFAPTAACSTRLRARCDCGLNGAAVAAEDAYLTAPHPTVLRVFAVTSMRRALDSRPAASQNCEPHSQQGHCSTGLAAKAVQSSGCED